MNVLNWLNKPYPFITNLKTNILISISFGFFVFLFLLIFQPFEISDIYDESKSIYLLGFGFITFLVVLVFFIVLPKIFNKIFNADNWTIRKEITFVLAIISIITILNYNYHFHISLELNKYHSLFDFIWHTIALSVFPVTFLVFVTELFLQKQHQKTANKVNIRIQENKIVQNTISISNIRITSDLKNEVLEICDKDLVYIQSDDNYCKVYYFNNDELKT